MWPKQLKRTITNTDNTRYTMQSIFGHFIQMGGNQLNTKLLL